MENKSSKIATTAFLILITSTVEMPGYLKYPMLAVATISFIITMVQIMKRINQSNYLQRQKNNDREILSPKN